MADGRKILRPPRPGIPVTSQTIGGQRLSNRARNQIHPAQRHRHRRTQYHHHLLLRHHLHRTLRPRPRRHLLLRRPNRSQNFRHHRPRLHRHRRLRHHRRKRSGHRGHLRTPCHFRGDYSAETAQATPQSVRSGRQTRQKPSWPSRKRVRRRSRQTALRRPHLRAVCRAQKTTRPVDARCRLSSFLNHHRCWSFQSVFHCSVRATEQLQNSFKPI